MLSIPSPAIRSSVDGDRFYDSVLTYSNTVCLVSNNQ